MNELKKNDKLLILSVPVDFDVDSLDTEVINLDDKNISMESYELIMTDKEVSKHLLQPIDNVQDQYKISKYFEC